MFIRPHARQHAYGLSGKGVVLVHWKRECESTARPPTSHHVSYSSHKLHVCAEAMSALHQHVFRFRGQYNGLHGWESMQTCVGNTLMAAEPLLFFCTRIYVD